MAISITHTFVSPVADLGDPNEVGPDEWNDAHVVTGAVADTITLTAGDGLTGGGDLSANRTFDVGAGTGITVNADDVALDTSSTRNTDHSGVTLTAGAGLTGGGDITANRTFTVGAGTGITVNADDVALTIPVAVSSGGTGQTTEAEAVGELIQALTEDATPSNADDFLGTYDASADTGKKVKLSTVIREKLLADRTYYVRTDGSDSNTGLVDSAGGAFLTIQKALDTVGGLDHAIYKSTIQVRDGTYAGNLTLPTLVGGVPAQSLDVGICKLVGDEAAPGDVIVSGIVTSRAASPGRWVIAGMTLDPNGAGAALDVGRGEVSIGDIVFVGTDSGGNYNIFVNTGGSLAIYDPVTLTDGDPWSFLTTATGAIANIFDVVTVSSDPAWGSAFVEAQGLSYQQWSSTPTGSATGSRYLVEENSVIQTFGGGATFFPGNAAGSAATGGQYI